MLSCLFVVAAKTNAPTYEKSKVTLDFKSFDLTYYFIPKEFDANHQLGNNVLSLDRGELHGLTSLHLLEALNADLGSSAVNDVNIIMQSVDVKVLDDGSSVLTESVIGNVAFSSPEAMVRVNDLDLAVESAFEGNGMDLYTFRLQIAEDQSLAQIAYILLGDTQVGNAANPSRGIGGGVIDDEDKLNTSMIAIAAAVAATFLALCGLGVIAYWYLYRRDDADHDLRKHLPSIVKNRSMTTRPTYEEDEPKDADDGQKAGGTGGEVSDDDDDENQSIGTSVYSYLPDDSSLSVSVAPSILYSIHETDSPSKIYTDTPSPKKSGKGSKDNKSPSQSVLWSVMDTLSHHFHDPSDNEAKNVMSRNVINTAALSPDKILGDIESESGASSSVLYDRDDTSLISDLGGGIASLTSPVKKDFESLWRDSEAGDTKNSKSPASTPSTRKQSPREAPTARKNNTTKALRAAKMASWSFSSDHSASSEATPVKTNNSMDKSLRSFDEEKLKSSSKRAEAKTGLPLPKAIESAMPDGNSSEDVPSEDMPYEDSASETDSPSPPKSATKRSKFVPSGLEGSATNVASARTKRISSKEWAQSPDNSARSGASETRLRSLLSSVKKAAEASTLSSKSHENDEREVDDEPSQILFDVDMTLRSDTSRILPEESTNSGSRSGGGSGGINDSRYISESDINDSNLQILPQDASIISGEKYDSINSPNTTPPTVDKFGNIWRDGTKVEESVDKDASETSHIKASTLIKSFDNVWGSKKSPSSKKTSVEVSIAESPAGEANDSAALSYLEEKSFDIPGAEDRLPFEDENLPDTSILSEASDEEVEVVPKPSSNKLGGRPPRTPRQKPKDPHLDEKKEDGDNEKTTATSPGDVSVDVNANYRGVSNTMASF